MKTALLPFAILLLVIFVKCDNPGEPSVTSSGNDLCSQLAGSKYIPVEIDAPLCIARDSSGVLYLVDKSGSQERFFFSSGDTMFRKMVTGVGIISQRYYFLSIAGGGQFIFENLNGVQGMAFFLESEHCLKCDSILNSHMYFPGGKSIDSLLPGWEDMCGYVQSQIPGCHTLSAAKLSDLEGYIVRNFSPVTHIEYLAEQEDNHYLLVTREEYDWHGDVVLHYGLPGEMSLRKVTRFLRASDGGSTWIKFMLGSTEAEAFFGVVFDTISGFSAGPSYIKIAGDSLDLRRLSPDQEIMDELGFSCSYEIR